MLRRTGGYIRKVLHQVPFPDLKCRRNWIQSTRSCKREHQKIVPKAENADFATIKTSGYIDHVTVMPVVCADGKSWNPAQVLK